MTARIVIDAERAAAHERRRAREEALAHRSVAALFATWSRECPDPAERRRYAAEARAFAALAEQSAKRAEGP